MINHVCHLTFRPSDEQHLVLKQECSVLADGDFEVSMVAVGALVGHREDIHLYNVAFPKSRWLRGRKLLKAIQQKSREIDAGIYHLHDPALLGIGKKLKKDGKIVVYSSHRDEPLARTKKHWLPKFLRKIPAGRIARKENRVFYLFDGLVASSTALKKRFLAFHSAVVEVSDDPKTWESESKKLLVLYRKLVTRERYGYS